MPSLAAILSFLGATLSPRRVRLLLPLLGLGLALPSLRAATFGDFQYTDTGTAITIDRYTGNGGAVAVPAKIDSKPVTTISYSAFSYHTGLTTITIPASVTSIGSYAFHDCSELSIINVDTANSAYASVGGVLFTKTLETLVRYPQAKTQTTFEIPSCVTAIGDGAFEDCSAITSITVPASITSLGDGVFYGCRGLTSITIPAGVASLGNWAFAECIGLASITIPASVTYIGNSTFDSCRSLTSITIPAGVTSLGDNAFYGCSGLTSITIPACVTSLGNSAFENCGGLTNITIPDSVTSIGNWAFENCTGLTSITIPSSVTSIGDSAFLDCSGLTGIAISASLTSIGTYTFGGCSRLTSITIPTSVTSIGRGGFAGCTKLTSVTIPNSVTNIGYSAFYECSGLTSITIPASVTSIGGYTFNDCSALTSAYFEGDAPSTFNTDVFRGTAPAFTILYRYGAAGFTSPTWNGYKTQALPVIATQPQSQTVVAGTPATLFVGAAGTDLTYQWFKGGAVVAGATTSTLDFARFNSADAGLYDAVVTGTGGEALTRPIVVGVVPATGERTAGSVSTRPEWQDIRHPVTGSVYDQFLLTGPAGTFTAAGTKIARMSFLDSNDSIVQVEMSGAGAITVVLRQRHRSAGPLPLQPSRYPVHEGKAHDHPRRSRRNHALHHLLGGHRPLIPESLTPARRTMAGPMWRPPASAVPMDNSVVSTKATSRTMRRSATPGSTLRRSPPWAGWWSCMGSPPRPMPSPYLYFATGGLVKVKIAGTALAQPIPTASSSAGSPRCGWAPARIPAGAPPRRPPSPPGSSTTPKTIAPPRWSSGRRWCPPLRGRQQPSTCGSDP
ncbi:MAG: leucine-rich repeat protein [Opitutaceae bacterium]|nr:leucine-rich repeat protein [Opitutaceae bacterium]